MKHIIDTDELEKLEVKGSVSSYNQKGEKVTDLWISKAEVLELLANSPQADGMVLVPIEPTNEILAAMREANYEHSEKYPIDNIQRSNRIYKAMLSAYKPQADDVRKDAWLPVETAPKDGSSFDVWLGNCDESDRQFYCTGNTRRSPDWHYKDGKFRPHISLGVMPTFVIPTHWMPLPAPPLDKARE